MMQAPTILKLGESLTIQQVTSFYDEVQTATITHPLIIDASQTKEIDTSGFQLLAFLINNAKTEIIWDPQPSAIFLNEANFLGMNKVLALIGGSK